MTEQLLSLGDYQITGVDFSPEMLRIARKRLSGRNVTLVCSDIMAFEADAPVEAAVSTGGAVYVVAEEGEFRIYSHVTDRETNERLLVKLNGQLCEDGLLVLAVQGPHTNYTKQLESGVVYDQRVERRGAYLDKWYRFSLPDGSMLTEQFCRFFAFDGLETASALERAGFRAEESVPGSKYLVCRKQSLAPVQEDCDFQLESNPSGRKS